MAQFNVNTHRFDPYKRFKFRVRWDGQFIAGIYRISGLRRWTEPVHHREGGDPNTPRVSPGLTTFDPIELWRGVTHDTAFEDWANKTWAMGRSLGSEVSLADYRKDIVIELLNEAGQIVMAYQVYRCWVSEYMALGELDASDSATAYEKITLQHEGWLRDESITEPEEPSIGS